MASPEAPRSTPAEPDWTDQVTDLVVDVVDTVRDKATGPIIGGARKVVYGTVALLVLVVVAVAGLVLAGRALFLLPVDEWVVYLGLGIIFCLAGFLAWSKRYAA